MNGTIPKMEYKTKLKKQIGLYCSICDDIIFSNSRHDWVSCACGEIFIDGGFDYLRIGAREEFPLRVRREVLTINIPFYYEHECGWLDKWILKNKTWYRLGRKVASKAETQKYEASNLSVERNNRFISQTSI